MSSNSEKYCANCKKFEVEASEYGWEAWCRIDYHDIENPLKEICDKWEES